MNAKDGRFLNYITSDYQSELDNEVNNLEWLRLVLCLDEAQK